MRELDELLQPFVHRSVAELDETELQSFNEMLDCQDQKLLSYLMLNEIPEDQGWVDVITKIRTSAGD